MKEIHQNTSFQIQLRGLFVGTGFGFSCMKRAYELHITGYLQYITHDKINIYALGKEQELIRFYKWCVDCTETQSGEYHPYLLQTPIPNDFNIINLV